VAAFQTLTLTLAQVVPTHGLGEHSGGFPLPPAEQMLFLQRVWNLNRSLFPPPPGFVSVGPLALALTARVDTAQEVLSQVRTLHSDTQASRIA
jgi:hypothetical protein